MKSLEELRSEIDSVDHQILALIQQRFEITHQVQKLKKHSGLPTEDLNREVKIVNQLTSQFPHLSKNLIQDLYSILFSYSKKSPPKTE